VIHLDVTNLERCTSVDPEDWTPTLSKSVGIIASGDAVAVRWNIQPVSSGTFATCAVALSLGIDNLATSIGHVDVAHQRTVASGGILLVAHRDPHSLGALLLLQMRLARRTRGRPTSTSA
jgi:hypothetical protein